MSQTFDLHQTQRNATTTIINNKWIPQPPTNLFKQPHVVKIDPPQGQENDMFRVAIQQSSLTFDINLLQIAFDDCFTNCHCSVDNVNQIFSVHTQVPSIASVSSNPSKVPIYLAVVQQHNVLDSWFIGYFSFISRKRSSSDFDTDEAKRSRSEQFLNYYAIPSHVPYVGLPPTEPSSRSREYFEDPLLNYPAAGSSTDYRTSDQFLNDPNFMPSNAPNTNTTLSQEQFMMPMMPSTTTTSTTTATTTSQPILPSPSMPALQIKPIQPTTETQPQPFQSSPPTENPFANYLNKPNLIIEGELKDMTENWKPEEEESQRRLVQFWRREANNEIFCQFDKFDIPPHKVDYSNMIVVSCIYWKEQNDFFITSVDCIYLLEHLIGVRFTVEEKNRIRRNLEGYKPLTVSKLKPESSEFFKLIMGFPNPKPRNIEKDLKVFHWSTLAVALKKIISKYTPSYSSTVTLTTTT